MEKQATNTLSTGVTAPPAVRTITQREANQMLRARAIERYDMAQTQRAQNIHAFESQFGRCDRIDQGLLRDLDSLMSRFAAIHARQQRTTHGEPKVSKYVEQLGTMRGSLSAHLATVQALELFAPVEKAEYLGWGGKDVGPKGHDESVLAGYIVVDEKRRAIAAASDEDDDELCRHEHIEPCEEDPSRGVCVNCDQEIQLRIPVDAKLEAA